LFFRDDIRDAKAIEAIMDALEPDVIVNHAAQMDVRKSVVNPVYDADVNILGTLNLLVSGQKHGLKKFVHISSGGAAYGEPIYNPVDEKHPIDPLCPYGITKHTFEHYLFTWKELYGFDYVVLRYPNVYGPRQNPYGEAGVTAIFAQQMLNGLTATINGDGEQTRDYVYVGDVAQVNVLALTDKMHGIYNVGWGTGLSVNDIFALLKKVTGYELMPEYGPAKLGETKNICLNAQKLYLETGWVPSVTILDGLKLLVEHLKKAR
jgi:UDP-glucose 4-epimerase